MRNSTRYSTVEQQTTLTFGSWQNRSTTRCQATKLLLIFFGIVSVLSLTLCGFNNLVVDYTTTMPTNTTTAPISATTVPEEETTLLSDLDYDDTTTNTTTVPISTTTVPISTTTVPISTTTVPISTTTGPISTTTAPISTTTTPEETTLLSDLDYDDTTVQLLRTPETRPGDVVITNKTIVINEVNNSLTVFD